MDELSDQNLSLSSSYMVRAGKLGGTLAWAGLELAGMLVLLRAAFEKHAGLNESRQPTPVERPPVLRALSARRGCVQRSAESHAVDNPSLLG